MSQKSKRTKIPTTKKNTNKKKVGSGAVKNFDTALFKKNEFALILIGALLLTVIIFFVFFRSSDQPSQPGIADTKASTSFESLEKRVAGLEDSLATGKKEEDAKINPKAADLVELTNRVTRLETAFQVKFDSLIERMGSLEKKIVSSVAVKKSAASKPVAKAAAKKAPSVAKTPVKKAVKKEKKASIFHTVTKGETLYSISKKYKTTVPVLRKLNKLSEKDKIFPGNNIIVR